jgi:hypothetical protein
LKIFIFIIDEADTVQSFAGLFSICYWVVGEAFSSIPWDSFVDVILLPVCSEIVQLKNLGFPYRVRVRDTVIANCNIHIYFRE